MDKVSREKATEEINGWLDRKKVYPSTREANEKDLELLIEAMVNGDIVLDEKTNEFTHTLLFPLEDTKSLKYKGRMNDKMLKPHLNGVSQKSGADMLTAYVAALTSQPKGLIESLDSADKKIAMAITVFFL
jgi:hypothetical protein